MIIKNTIYKFAYDFLSADEKERLEYCDKTGIYSDHHDNRPLFSQVIEQCTDFYKWPLYMVESNHFKFRQFRARDIVEVVQYLSIVFTSDDGQSIRLQRFDDKYKTWENVNWVEIYQSYLLEQEKAERYYQKNKPE